MEIREELWTHRYRDETNEEFIAAVRTGRNVKDKKEVEDYLKENIEYYEQQIKEIEDDIEFGIRGYFSISAEDARLALKEKIIAVERHKTAKILKITMTIEVEEGEN